MASLFHYLDAYVWGIQASLSATGKHAAAVEDDLRFLRSSVDARNSLAHRMAEYASAGASTCIALPSAAKVV